MDPNFLAEQEYPMANHEAALRKHMQNATGIFWDPAPITNRTRTQQAQARTLG